MPTNFKRRNEEVSSRRAAVRSATGILALSALLGTAVPVAAHHGTTVTYDNTRILTLTGTVTQWDFIFPHPTIYFDVADASGKVEHWGAETGANPAYYMRDKRGGINRNSLKPGDKLQLTCYAHRTPGAKACLTKEIIVNGKPLEGLAFRLPDPQPSAAPPAPASPR